LEDCDKWGLNSTNEAFASIASIDSNSFYKPTNSLGYWKKNLVLPSTTTTPIIPCLSSCVHQIWSWPFEFDDLFSKLKIQPLKFFFTHWWLKYQQWFFFRYNKFRNFQKIIIFWLCLAIASRSMPYLIHSSYSVFAICN
jgi:hypothetical protein